MLNRLIIMLVIMSTSVSGQVKIGTTSGAAHASAALEFESTSKGVLLPRMTTTQRAAINSPATGLMVYNTSFNCVEMYNGSSWGCLNFIPSPTPSAGGSTFTSFSNGTAMFNTNTACTTALISAGYSAVNCSGVVTVGSNSYNQVLINGQCWMQTNLEEAPTNFAYNNTWLNTSLADLGRWGYYNTTTTNGAGGFQSTEPGAGEGYLYQWSAAMNNSTTERAQGVCPSGWHVPSDCEYMYLEHGLGMSVGDQVSTGTGTRTSGSVGSKLSTLTSGGTNSSGWTGRLTGYRDNTNGSFGHRGTLGHFWTSSASGTSNAFYRDLISTLSSMERHTGFRPYAFSVRCLKD
jgi:uncharacterized protein (TIGR02145 family)